MEKKGGEQIQDSKSISELDAIPQENTALCYILEDIWTGPVLCFWEHFVEGRKGRDSLQTFSCVSTRRRPCRVRSVVSRKEEGQER